MTAAERITEQLASYDDWRGALLARLREFIHASDPSLQEGWKWDVPVWTSPNGKLVCAISAFKDHVKLNFFQGAHLPDPQHVFTSGLDSKAHRSINFAANDSLPEAAVRELIRAAADYNTSH